MGRLGDQEARMGVSCTCTPAPLNQCEASDISPLPAPFKLLIFLRTPACCLGSSFQREYFLLALQVYVALCKRGTRSSWAFLFPHPLSPHTPPWRNHHTSLFQFLTPPKSIFLKIWKGPLEVIWFKSFILQSSQSKPKEVMVSKLAQGQGLL